MVNINAKQALSFINSWLANILAYQPSKSQLGEQWYLNLHTYILSLDDNAEFELDFGSIFAEGQVFEQIMENRFANEDFWVGLRQTTEVITGQAMVPDNWLQWFDDMQTQLTMLKTLNTQLQNTPSYEQLKQAQLMSKLRGYVIQGDWSQFISHMHTQEHMHIRLMTSCYIVASDVINTIEQLDRMRLKRNQIWLEYNDELYSPIYYRKAFADFTSWISQLFADEAYDKAFKMADVVFDKFPLGVDDSKLNKNQYANLYLDLSYYYVEQHLPRKTFDMLYPIIEKIDTDESWKKVSSDTRARLIANFEASQVHMRDNGETLPDNITLFSKLSKADEDWIDEKDEIYEKKISERKPQEALDIVHEVQQLLDKKQVSKKGYRHLYWQIEEARALRNLGHYADAITVLLEVIRIGEKTEHTHSKQQVPRAKLALALCYKRQKHNDEAQAIYEAMIRDQYCSEDNTIMCGVYTNLANILADKGQFREACEHYLQSESYGINSGLIDFACERAWFAFEEAKKANDGPKQIEILQKIIDDYAMTADEKVQKIVADARKTLSLVENKSDDNTKGKKRSRFWKKLFIK
ncbi:tetratricopeptide repeat protein [Psychrobacter lutiphocae]|uniref:tetratricopeptide repeat protein n=1 Tax=Psychrobacter lutiphocae TaxID=540500 RepID=UPI00036CD8BD|nr:tetratricopeptide repeat protein [Psychrobacter lutiphocae]